MFGNNLSILKNTYPRSSGSIYPTPPTENISLWWRADIARDANNAFIDTLDTGVKQLDEIISEGGSSNLVQNTVANQGLWKPTTINNLPSVLFNTDDFMAAGLVSPSTPVVWCVFRTPSSIVSSDHVLYFHKLGDPNQTLHLVDDGGDFIEYRSSIGQLTISTNTNYVTRHAIADRRYYLNSLPTPSSVNAFGSTTLDLFTIGTGNSKFISEILITDTTDDDADLQTYFADRYGISFSWTPP